MSPLKKYSIPNYHFMCAKRGTKACSKLFNLQKLNFSGLLGRSAREQKGWAGRKTEICCKAITWNDKKRRIVIILQQPDPLRISKRLDKSMMNFYMEEIEKKERGSMTWHDHILRKLGQGWKVWKQEVHTEDGRMTWKLYRTLGLNHALETRPSKWIPISQPRKIKRDDEKFREKSGERFSKAIASKKDQQQMQWPLHRNPWRVPARFSSSRRTRTEEEDPKKHKIKGKEKKENHILQLTSSWILKNQTDGASLRWERRQLSMPRVARKRRRRRRRRKQLPFSLLCECLQEIKEKKKPTPTHSSLASGSPPKAGL